MKYLKHTLIILFLSAAVNSFGQGGGYYNLGMQLMMKNDFKGAIAHLETAEAKSPDNPNVSRFLVYAYFQCKEYEKSITAYSKLIALKPTDNSAYYY